MPGLSSDPTKRQRQLDALRAGRRKLAQQVLDGQDVGPDPAPDVSSSAPVSPSGKQAPSSEHPAPAGALGVPVHRYGPPPKPPVPEPDPDALPVDEPPAAPAPAPHPQDDHARAPRRRGGFLAGFCD